MDTKGYSTSMMISTLKKLDGVQTLNRGASETIAIPAHRMAQRVFGEGSLGRSKLLSAGPSMSVLASGYDPRMDTCVKALVRMI